MPKGKHKGGRRLFTNFQEMEVKKAKEEEEKAWRKARGEVVSDSEEEEKKEDESEESSTEEDSSEEESSSDEEKPASGISGLIQIENPNRVVQKEKKVSNIDASAAPDKPTLSRRQREEIQKQRNAANYRKLHQQGKTEEARADLERLALIRKQRQEANERKAEEKKEKEAAMEAKRKNVAKVLNKKKS